MAPRAPRARGAANRTRGKLSQIKNTKDSSDESEDNSNNDSGDELVRLTSGRMLTPEVHVPPHLVSRPVVGEDGTGLKDESSLSPDVRHNNDTTPAASGTLEASGGDHQIDHNIDNQQPEATQGSHRSLAVLNVSTPDGEANAALSQSQAHTRHLDQEYPQNYRLDEARRLAPRHMDPQPDTQVDERTMLKRVSDFFSALRTLHPANTPAQTGEGEERKPQDIDAATERALNQVAQTLHQDLDRLKTEHTTSLTTLNVLQHNSFNSGAVLDLQIKEREAAVAFLRCQSELVKVQAEKSLYEQIWKHYCDANVDGAEIVGEMWIKFSEGESKCRQVEGDAETARVALSEARDSLANFTLETERGSEVLDGRVERAAKRLRTVRGWM